MVLGNGEVGKTQLCRWLRGERFDERVPTTRGVTVSAIDVPGGEGRSHLWDFGGQDIYHSTHTLFLRSRAIFLIAWTPAKEARDADGGGEPGARNYPLAYWLDYLRELGGAHQGIRARDLRYPERHPRPRPAPRRRRAARGRRTERG